MTRGTKRKNDLILQEKWYTIRRLSNKTIEILSGPHNTMRAALYAAGFDHPYGWSIEQGKKLDLPLVDTRK